MRSRMWLRRRSAAALPALALWLLSASPLRAADRWVPVGPEGGTVVGLAFDAAGPQTLYAALADAGVFRGTRGDGGAISWTAAREGLGPGRITCLAADPATPGVLYVGRDGEGLWKSADGGGSWAAVAATLGGQPADVGALFFDPSTRALYAGLAPLIGQAPRAGQAPLWRSDDGGEHWSALDLGTEEWTVTALAAAGGKIYAGVRSSSFSSGGVFRSADGGASWSFSSLGAVNGLAAGGGKVWATAATGLQVSADGGASWKVLFVPLPNPGRPGLSYLSAVAVDPAHPSILYFAFGYAEDVPPLVNGLFRSTDGGVTNERLGGFPNAAPQAILVGSTAVGVLAAPGHFGVWSSADDGESWAPHNAGMRAAPVFRVVVDPLRPSILYVGAGDGGLLRSTDGGVTWRRTGDRRIFAPLVLDPQKPATVYAQGGDAVGNSFLFKSTNGARTWSLLAPGDAGNPLDLALDPRRPRILYAALDSQFGSVARSTDGGATWASGPLTCTSPQHLAVAPTGEVYAGGASHCGRLGEIEGGVDRSDDGGRTFVNKRQGLPGAPVTLALAVDPARPATVYAGVRGIVVDPEFSQFFGVYRTRDRAEHWERVAGLLGLTARATGFAFAPAGGKAIFVASDGQGIWRSGDAGESWRSLAVPGLPTARVFDLEFDRRSPATLYAATPGGLYRLDHE